jgi:hypothetical protein
MINPMLHASMRTLTRCLNTLCFFADTRHGEPSRSSWKHSPEELKGEGNRKLSNQEKVRGLNIISKVIGLVKDKDLTPETPPTYG